MTGREAIFLLEIPQREVDAAYSRVRDDRLAGGAYLRRAIDDRGKLMIQALDRLIVLLEHTHWLVTAIEKTAVVLGGTREIGKAIAHEIAAEGENVVPASWGKSSVAATTEEICERGSDATEATCEVTDSASIAALRDQETFDGVDTLINSPSGIVRKPVAKIIDGTGDTS